MYARRKPRPLATLSTLTLATLSALPGAGMAAEATDADDIERIEVTGSRIRRTDVENANPIFNIDRQAIEHSGVTTIGELIQRTPSMAGAATNPQVNNGGGTGAATVSLRGVGSNRTLVLINGRRFVSTDINTLPMNLIERVEILKDGASAIYGSDAVAGVVNFITRKDFEGVEAEAYFGQTSEGDADTNQVSVTAGLNGEKGNITFGASYFDQKAISAADREFSRAPYALFNGEEVILGSSRTPTGFLDIPDGNALGLPANVYTRIAGRPGTAAGDYREFVGDGPNNDTYNFAPANYLITPQERTSAFFQGHYEIFPGITWHSSMTYTLTSSDNRLAPDFLDSRESQNGTPISATNAYNPFGVDLEDVRVRLESQLGPRTSQFDTHNFDIYNALEGEFGNGWQWQALYTWGQIDQDSTDRNYVFLPAARDALGPSFQRADGSFGCGVSEAAAIRGCVPINLLGEFDPNDAEQAEAWRAISPNLHDRLKQQQQVAEASLNGDITDLPAGPLGFAAGVQHRWEKNDFDPDYLKAQNLTTFGLVGPVKGDYDVTEAFAEFNIPLLADAPFVESLELNLGLRTSDYSNFGRTTNGKASILYRPTRDIVLRGTAAEVFRAPNLNELFTGAFDSADTFVDPCNGLTTPVGANASVDAACQNVARDGSFEQTDTQLNSRQGGNADLQPEEGDVYTAGVVYSPSWLDGFSTTVDWYRIKLDDTIGRVGTQNVLDLCYNQGLYCDRFTRDNKGEIFLLTDLNVNVGSLEAEGVDINLRYNLPETAIGVFQFNLDASYLIQNDVEAIAGNSDTLVHNAGWFRDSSAGGNGHYARWRAQSTVNWSYQSFEATWNARYIGGLKENPGDTGEPDDPGFVSVRNIPSKTYHDLQLSYNVEDWGTRFTLGVDNVANTDPPRIYSGFNSTTDDRTYPLMGRFWYARVTQRF